MLYPIVTKVNSSLIEGQLLIQEIYMCNYKNYTKSYS
jgi:hypothetical protein